MDGVVQNSTMGPHENMHSEGAKKYRAIAENHKINEHPRGADIRVPPTIRYGVGQNIQKDRTGKVKGR